MISTSHLLIGSALGAAVQNPVGAFFVGAASHFAADALPHLDIGSFRDDKRKGTLVLDRVEYIEAYLDIIIGGLVVLFFVFNLPPNHAAGAFWGAAGGISIDVIDNSPYWSAVVRKWPVFNTIHKMHENIHKDIGNHMPKKFWILGILTQIICGGASLFYLFKLTGII
jgi:hypothetical protein